jgi:hypothetical protein
MRKECKDCTRKHGKYKKVKEGRENAKDRRKRIIINVKKGKQSKVKIKKIRLSLITSRGGS